MHDEHRYDDHAEGPYALPNPVQLALFFGHVFIRFHDKKYSNALFQDSSMFRLISTEFAIRLYISDRME